MTICIISETHCYKAKNINSAFKFIEYFFSDTIITQTEELDVRLTHPINLDILFLLQRVMALQIYLSVDIVKKVIDSNNL